MGILEALIAKKVKLSLIGLGYVGMPIAVAFSSKVAVIGYDVNEEKIELYRRGKDPTKEVGDEKIANCEVEFTSVECKLREARFHIVAVPTPVNKDNTPDLRPIKSASETLGRNLTKGSIVVYESTVYPGVTEDVCVPILECVSGLKCGTEFKVGYSPERINPGDKQHRLDTIVKVVSGMDDETLNTIAEVYGLVALAGVYRAESIKVAEAAKVIENSQRDINIAFMNELSIIFNKMDIDTKAVLKAANTKWNFLNFQPGLVGGHCIGVDPYYLTYMAEQMGYHSQVILSGRRINDDMGRYIVENLIKKLSMANVMTKNTKVAILGLTFKENCPDIRNSRVVDIVKELKEYGICPVVCDSMADKEKAKQEYDIILVNEDEIIDMDAIIVAVAHKEYIGLSFDDLDRMFKRVPNDNRVLIDVKGLFDRNKYHEAGYQYWRL